MFVRGRWRYIDTQIKSSAGLSVGYVNVYAHVHAHVKTVFSGAKKRFVAVLNGKIEIGRLLNALGHMSAGLVAQVTDKIDLCFLDYRDKDGGLHPSISHFPFIVLKAENSNQIRKVRQEALTRGIPYTDFTQTMIVGTSQEQLTATAAHTETELEYFGVCLFSDTEILREFTKKFSLYR